MARTNQKLINYHTGSASAMPQTADVEYGEIVVRHNAEEPQLLIKVNNNETEEFRTFIASGAVETAIKAVETTIGGNVDALESALSALSATVKSDYATSADTVAAVNAAETAAKNYADSQDDALSGRIVTYVNEVSGNIETTITGIESRVDDLETFKTNVETNYATKTEVQTAKDEAVTSAYTASTAYTDQKVGELSGNVVNYVNQVSGNIETVVTGIKSGLDTLSGSVVAIESDYATKEFVGAASGYAYNQAKADVIGENTDTKDDDTVWGAKAYADDKVKTLSGDVVTYIDGKIETATSDVSELSGAVETLSGSVVTMSGDIKTYIDNELSTVYTYKNSVADYAALQAIVDPEVGDVYNVVAAHGNPGDADYTPAGTNYAWNGTAWDALGGTVDLSNYATTGAVNFVSGEVTTLKSTVETATGNIQTVSGKVVELSGKVVSDYATSANTENAINAAKVAAEIASSAYTDSQIQMLSGVTSAYVANQLSTIEGDITDLKTFTAETAATHAEVAAASAATFESAYTNAIHASSAYTDAEIIKLIGDMTGDTQTLGGLEDQIDALSAGTEQRFTTNENKITNLETSAATWNELTAGAVNDGQLATVASDAEGVTTNSGARMAKDGTVIKLDLTDLYIDCGDF